MLSSVVGDPRKCGILAFEGGKSGIGCGQQAVGCSSPAPPKKGNDHVSKCVHRRCNEVIVVVVVVVVVVVDDINNDIDADVGVGVDVPARWSSVHNTRF